MHVAELERDLINVDDCLDQKHPQFLSLCEREIPIQLQGPLIIGFLVSERHVHPLCGETGVQVRIR